MNVERNTKRTLNNRQLSQLAAAKNTEQRILIANSDPKNNTGNITAINTRAVITRILNIKQLSWMRATAQWHGQIAALVVDKIE
jgi:hypothetical protein